MSKPKSARGSSNTQESSDLSQLMSTDDLHLEKTEAMFTRLVKIISESFTNCVTKLTSAIESKFETKFEAAAAEIFSLSTKVDRLEKKIEELASSNKSLLEENSVLTQNMKLLTLSFENLDQYSRSDSLLIHGIPTPIQGTVENLLVDIPALLNRLFPSIPLTSEGISVAHRLPSQPNILSSSSPPRPPPVVVRFVRRQTRSLFMHSRKSLKGQPYVLSDHLTTTRASLLKKASTLVSSRKIASAWSQDGKILIKTLQNRTATIQSEVDLSAYI